MMMGFAIQPAEISPNTMIIKHKPVNLVRLTVSLVIRLISVLAVIVTLIFNLIIV